MAGASLPDQGRSASELQQLASELGVKLDRAQCERLVRFADLLLRWNHVYNLTAIERPEQILTHHLLDSLALVSVVDGLNGAPLSVLDAGAGGGLPGVPLSVARPDHRYALLDKVGKKVAFLQQAKVELDLANVEVVHARIEQFTSDTFDLIVSRAFASLADFIGLTQHLLKPSGTWIAMKGAMPDDEIAELARRHPQVRLARTVKLRVPRLQAERHLLLIEPN